MGGRLAEPVGDDPSLFGGFLASNFARNSGESPARRRAISGSEMGICPPGPPICQRRKSISRRTTFCRSGGSLAIAAARRARAAWFSMNSSPVLRDVMVQPGGQGPTTSVVQVEILGRTLLCQEFLDRCDALFQRLLLIQQLLAAKRRLRLEPLAIAVHRGAEFLPVGSAFDLIVEVPDPLLFLGRQGAELLLAAEQFLALFGGHFFHLPAPLGERFHGPQARGQHRGSRTAAEAADGTIS